MDKIYSVNGPVVKVADTKSFAMQEMVYVGKSRLVGEVIRMNDKETTIQVYEETGGLAQQGLCLTSLLPQQAHQCPQPSVPV